MDQSCDPKAASAAFFVATTNEASKQMADLSSVFLVLIKHQETGAERYLLEDGSIVPRRFTDPIEAARVAKELNDWAKRVNVADRYRVLKEGQEKPKVDWRERERLRFLSGRYLHTVWSTAGWAVPHVQHFCHVALDDSRYVAYTPDNAHGEADKQMRISPDGYLKKYFSNILTPDNIQHFANEHLDKYGPQPEVFWAHTPDEFEAVYTESHSSLASCMTHEKSYFSSSIHPVRVYGAGDLALAYIRGADGKICARTMCWPAKKRYTRLYGRERRLRLALEKLGYKEASFDGAKLLKVEDKDGTFVCPYIDHHGHVSLTDAHLIVGGNGEMLPCDSTNGLVTLRRMRCYHCGDRLERDDAYERRNRYYCRTCWDDLFMTCSDCGEAVPHEDACEAFGESYCETCYGERYTRCHECDHTIEHAEAHRWERRDYCDECYSDIVAVCDGCETRVARDYTHEHDDQTLCQSCHDELINEEQAENEPEQTVS
jgi:hypothetical protein